jgi:hypothetical protein
MTDRTEYAKRSLVQLVAYVSEHQGGPIGGIPYEELARRVGHVTKNGKGWGHGMGFILGEMGHMLDGLHGPWGEQVPHIQSLVVNKTGQNAGLPDDGIREFWPDYPQLTHAEKTNLVRTEYEAIVNFGSRWEDVLRLLGLKPEAATPGIPAPLGRRRFGGGGESADHKALKEYIKAHPDIVGARENWECIVEYALPTLDVIDVFFRSERAACISVEVKSRISDFVLEDYERGIYQTIKYDAVLRAMAKHARYAIPSNIRSALVVETKLPAQYRELAKILNVQVFEGVRVAS